MKIVITPELPNFFEVTVYRYRTEIGYITFVIEDRGKWKGWVRAVNTLVEPEYRNRGICTGMYMAAFKWICQQGYKGIYSNPSMRISDWTDAIWKKHGTGKRGRFNTMKNNS